VVSDLRLQRGSAPSSNLLGLEEADVLLAFDLLAAVGPNTLKAGEAGHTVVVGSTTVTPTGGMVADPSVPYPDLDDLQGRLDEHSRPDANVWLDSGRLSRALLGSAAPANMLLLGAAYQAGVIPVSAAAIEQAVDLNGVAVDANRDAFRWGRRWVVDPEGVSAAASSSVVAPPEPEVVVPELAPQLARRVDEIGVLLDLLAMLAADLAAYQDRVMAEAYLGTVGRVAEAERRICAGSTRLTEAVARNLHKLLAYKDEYEVARLLLGPEGEAAAASVGSANGTVRYHLHPPLLKRFGLDHKIGLRRELARPAMRALARGRRLRGTALDPFGRTPLRRIERELPDEYRQVVDRLLAGLTPDRLDDAVAIAELPDLVRGYEDLKLRRVGEYRAELARRLADYPG
jgi:indolepyruvate ferredoxin oxidoreductase